MLSRYARTRFRAVAVFAVDEAKEFVARIHEEFVDATHNVPAYLIGYGASVVARQSQPGTRRANQPPVILISSKEYCEAPAA